MLLNLKIKKTLLLLMLTCLTVGIVAQSGMRSGIVQSAMHAGGYSYLRVLEADSSYWAAVSEITVSPGDSVEFHEQMWMRNFHSKKLSMTFPKILFAANVKLMGGKGSAVDMVKLAHSHADIDFRDIKDLKRMAKDLSGSNVAIRGEVVKVLPNIMGKTWVHVQDAASDSSRIVITTNTAQVKVGAQVSVLGKLTVDKDFGMGYFYPHLIEEAVIIN